MPRLRTDLILATATACLPVCAQTPPRPAGIYCSCPATSSSSSSFIAAVAAKPWVDGFLVRVGWDALEPTPGTYDWTLLDQQIALASAAGKKIALAVVQGTHTPAWLSSANAETYTFDFRGSVRTIALPWDPVYLQRWSSFVADLGARYATNRTIALVHATHASQNGFEMQLPFLEEAGYLARGYTDARYAQSWIQVLDAFFQSFPSHPIDMDLHPIWNSDAVAQEVLAYGLDNAPGRFGAFGGWWSLHNALNSYPGIQLLFEESAERSFTNVQNVGAFVRTPERYGSNIDEYEGAYDGALATGIRYIEVWNGDILEPSLEPILTRVAQAIDRGGWYQLYPSPLQLPAVAHRIEGSSAPGETLSLTIDGAPASSLGFFLLGRERTDLPLLDQRLLLGPTEQLLVIGVSIDAMGVGRLTVTMPSDTSFLPLTSQAALTTTPGTLVLTNAAELR